MQKKAEYGMNLSIAPLLYIKYQYGLQLKRLLSVRDVDAGKEF
jgi:hypothetical protein